MSHPTFPTCHILSLRSRTESGSGSEGGRRLVQTRTPVGVVGDSGGETTGDDESADEASSSGVADGLLTHARGKASLSGGSLLGGVHSPAPRLYSGPPRDPATASSHAAELSLILSTWLGLLLLLLLRGGKGAPSILRIVPCGARYWALTGLALFSLLGSALAVSSHGLFSPNVPQQPPPTCHSTPHSYQVAHGDSSPSLDATRAGWASARARRRRCRRRSARMGSRLSDAVCGAGDGGGARRRADGRWWGHPPRTAHASYGRPSRSELCDDGDDDPPHFFFGCRRIPRCSAGTATHTPTTPSCMPQPSFTYTATHTPSYRPHL